MRERERARERERERERERKRERKRERERERERIPAGRARSLLEEKSRFTSDCRSTGAMKSSSGRPSRRLWQSISVCKRGQAPPVNAPYKILCLSIYV